jgi:hypothetical protein
MAWTEAEIAAWDELCDMGAVKERRQDRHGDDRSGWWLDDVWLGPSDDPRYALAVARGETC